MLRGFRTYDLSLQLYRGCEAVTASHHLKDQLLRAALSIVLNTAEGSAKPTLKDRRRFYAIALGSCREVQALIQVLRRDEQLGSRVRSSVPDPAPVPVPET